MKVIKNGREKVYTCTCAKCKSDLEYTEDDVYYITEDKKGGLRKTISHWFKPDENYVNVYSLEYRCVECPVCSYVIKDINKMSLGFRWEKETEKREE